MVSSEIKVPSRLSRINKLVSVLSACGLLLGWGLLAETGADETDKTLWDYEFERTNIDEEIYYLDYQSRSERIEVTAVSNIGENIAEQMIDEKVFLFGSLFEKQRVGYQGQHTEHIQCQSKFKPDYSERALHGGFLKYFKGFANERYAFGACDEQSIAYTAVNAYFYCRGDDTMYDLSYFSLARSDQDTARFIRGIRCR